ncbi:dihydrofolate reductase [Bacillus sp. 1NLA3E]|uniref:dihydrofolate reductase n=1 Tax=Bacillus sp. 1NLA3E TaxID=666686 RepID=UPI000247F2AA|nr:dihydrofolate reductase [Bacillus sp. 1NLA3E]AGK54592.1 dihydrofolate reductase [Bacillus sp. 1NLA3E]
MISLIWAMDENRVIGKDNQLPWHLPEDLKFFKKTTTGHPIAMGRKTHVSIGRPLPGRENIIITRNQEYTSEGCIVLHSVQELLHYAQQYDKEVFIIGGAEIFKEVFPFADRLYITKIYETFDGDTFFPDIDMEQWKLLFSEPGVKNEKNPYHYEFFIYQRK